ncbi:RDD family protein [Nocardioides litoris]|uniref:RDD family protein n=1 Tax=Nocardioides litoris TaxID=1926648 RepID=UPI001FEB01BC|nr:RDD family protein [Nocardioides litoris]
MSTGVSEGLPTASWGRRFAALFVDWIASTMVTVLIVGPAAYGETGSPTAFVTPLVYAVEAALLTWLVGGSFGKIVLGLRVVPEDGVLRPLSPLRLLARQLLVVLVIPPLVFRPDGRGLHDVLCGTATVRVDTFRAMLAGARGPQGR